MKQKDKELLLKDLSARLPYHVVVSTGEDNLELVKVDILNEIVYLFSESFLEFDVSEIKPYLRPLSSMTKEEVDGFFAAGNKDMDILENALSHEPIITFGSKIHHGGITYNEVDYLLAHHFDFRGLIPLGLALEAPKGMY